MIVERSMHPEWLSNAYLVADEAGGHGVIVDSGAPPEPLLEAIERHELTVEHLLLTHHHHDHVAENHVYRERLGVQILAHALEAEQLLDVDRRIEPREKLEIGGLAIETLHTPGHTAGMLNFLVNGSDVLTGDTLFKGSVGGVRAPGSTGFEDIRSSILEVLMKLPPETRVHPGHTDPTTIGAEWESNAFIRVWRGLDEGSSDRCKVGEEEATLVLLAPDYDGGHKAWVRWDESGKDDIVPGSMVVREGEEPDEEGPGPKQGSGAS
jgi:hydroxyacylglutathione hydrolase